MFKIFPQLFFLVIFFILQVTGPFPNSWNDGMFDASNTKYQDNFGANKKNFEILSPFGILRYGEEAGLGARAFENNKQSEVSRGRANYPSFNPPRNRVPSSYYDDFPQYEDNNGYNLRYDSPPDGVNSYGRSVQRLGPYDYY